MSCCSDVMKPIDVSACCTPQDTAARAAQVIRDSGCGCAPVIENTESLKVIGVVTERDICCRVAADNLKASEVGVTDSMQPSSACCGVDEPLEEARRKMDEHKTSSLPVVDKTGSCCGTVSLHHIIKT